MKKFFLIVFVSVLLLGCATIEKTWSEPIKTGQSSHPTASASVLTPVPATGNADVPPAPPSDTQDVPSGPPSDASPSGPIPSSNQVDVPPAPPSSGPDQPSTVSASASSEGSTSAVPADSLAGSWRVYSTRIFYDVGGAGAMGSSYETLQLTSDNTWTFGSSRGRWQTAPIDASDWKKWGVSSYGPTQKIVLMGWNQDQADGPIEAESDGVVDFVWVIYHVQPPLVQNPGEIQTKFGH